MNLRSSLLLICGCSTLLLGAIEGQRGRLQAAGVKARLASVSRPVAREVTDYADFTGRTQAAQSVNVVARATGYLTKEPFKEGSEVKAGDLLFEIDPRPYQVQYDLGLAQVNLATAQLKLAQATLSRDDQISRTTPGVVSASQLDQDRGAVNLAEAQVNIAKVNLESCKLHLDFCRVTAPIGGQVSHFYLTPGNVVIQDQTVLANIVSFDPIYACFDIDESTFLRMRRAADGGRARSNGSAHHAVFMSLQGEEGFPHHGEVDLVDNQVNPTTGSILARGVFANPIGANGHRLLVPGMFVRIRLPIGQPHPALLVTERAIGSDQGLKFVYVVRAGKIERQHIQTGPLEADGLRVVTGLKPDDLVVVGDLRQVRQGMEVQAETIPMPVAKGSQAERAEPASQPRSN
jgi:multidrug efflux system membrane fusion protein